MRDRTDADGRLVLTVATDEYRCASLTFSHDGTLLALGKSNGLVGIWDLNAGRAIKHFLHDLRGDPVTAVAFSLDDSLLATGGEDGHLKIRDLRTTKLVLRRQHPAPIRAIAFDPAGGLVATACDDGALRVWTRRGRIRSQIDGGCTPATRRITFAAEGRLGTSDQSPTGALWAELTPGELRVYRSSV